MRNKFHSFRALSNRADVIPFPSVVKSDKLIPRLNLTRNNGRIDLSVFISISNERRLISNKGFMNICNRRPIDLVNISQPSRHLCKLMSSLRRTFSNGSVAQTSISHEQQKLLSDSKGNKQVDINVRGKVYAELAKTRPVLFGSAPKNAGINFTVKYYDSVDLVKSSGRVNGANLTTVCLLHGAPGHYKDYASLINYLTHRGIRVIAPNFPDYSATLDHNFRHSPQERMNFIIEFLDAVKVNKIDLIVGHSSAVYTIFELLDHCYHNTSGNPRRRIKSIGLFSTPSYDLPQNMAATPFRLLVLKLFDFPIFRPIITALIESFVRIQGIQNRVDKNKIDDLLIAASAVGYSDYNKMKDQLKLVNVHNIPVILVYGTSDRLIPTSCFNQLTRDLGVDPRGGVKYYNSDGKVQKDILKSNDLVYVSQFESGGHYTFQRYSEQVNKDVHEFLLGKVIRSQSE